MARKEISLLVILLFLMGCATNSSELHLGKWKEKDRLYVGRVIVNFGDLPPEDLKCEVYINRDIVPIFKLDRDGYFFYKTDREEARLSRISCYHRPNFYMAAWHHHSLPLKPFKRPADSLEATYFGDVYVTWKFDKTGTISAAEKEPMTSTPPRIGNVQDSGSLTVEIKSDFELMKRLFFEKVPNARDYQFNLKETLIEKN